MNTTFAGLDIGFDSLKYVELQRGKSGLVLTKYLTKLCNLNDSKSNIEEKVSDVIEEFFRENNLKPVSIVISVSGQSVFTRFIKLPTLDKTKIDQIVRYEAQQQVPFPIDEVIWDYQLIGNWEVMNELDEANVALVASKKELVENLLMRFEGLKIAVEYVDIAPFSLCNCVKFNDSNHGQCSLILDIGAKSTNMLVLENGHIWTRSIPIAGISLTQAIAKEFKINFEEAEKMKLEFSVVLCGKGPMVGEAPERLRISRAISNTLSRLMVEVSRSIGFYRTHSGGGGINSIFLCGGSSKIENISQFFASKFNIDVSKLDTIRNLDIETEDGSRIEEDRDIVGGAVGLALRQATQCVMEINLLPKKVVTQRDIARKRGYIIGCFCLVILMLVSGVLYFKQWSSYEKSVEVSLSADLKRLKDQNLKMQKEKKHIEDICKKMSELNSIQSDRTYWVRLLNDFSTILPKDCWLKRFTVTPGRTRKQPTRVKIVGETMASLGEISEIKEKLEDTAYFSNVKIRSADDLSAASVDSADIRRFEMVCDLVRK